MTSDGIIQRAFKKFGDRPYPYITKGQLTELQQEIVAEIKKERKHYCGDNVSRGSDFCFDYVLIDKLLGTESEEKDAAYFVKHSIPNDMKFEDTESEAKKIKYDTESTIAAKITNKPAPVEPQPKKSDPAADPDCDCSDCNN